VDKNVFIRIEKVVTSDKKFLAYSDNNFETDEDPSFISHKKWKCQIERIINYIYKN